MKNIRWVVQNNLIKEGDLEQIREACKDKDIEMESVDVTPFTSDMPVFTIDKKTNIYYGSTTFMYNIYNQLNKPDGLFFDSDTFSMENYQNKWGEYMLNSDADIIPIEEIYSMDTDPEQYVFIRPDGDGKEFDGQAIKFKEVKPFFERYISHDSRLTIDSKVVIGPAYNIHKEWRNYIVNGEIITSSLYRQNFKLKKSATDIPQDMLDFVKARIKEYSPHRSFAIDIASTEDGTYYIIECGCLNSVGFYSCDIKKLIYEISEDVSKKIITDKLSHFPHLHNINRVNSVTMSKEPDQVLTICGRLPETGDTFYYNVQEGKVGKVSDKVFFTSKNGVLYSNREVTLKKISEFREEKINNILE